MIYDAGCISLFQQRIGWSSRWLLWVRAKTLDTNASVDFGFWTGETSQTFTVESASRTYSGGQDMNIGPIRYGKGVEALPLEITMGLTSEVENMVRGFNVESAPCELHAAIFHPQTSALVGFGRAWVGVVDTVALTIGEVGGSSSLSLVTYSSAIKGTVTGVGLQSDASQRRRLSTDRFREYGSLGRRTNDPLGAKK